MFYVIIRLIVGQIRISINLFIMEYIYNKKLKIPASIKGYLGKLERALRDDFYNSPEAVLHLSEDKRLLKQSFAVSKDKSKLNLKEVMIIGIGGSCLGARAVYEFLRPNNVTLSFFDTADVEVLNSACARIRSIRESGCDVLINFISKSGSTVETMMNARILIHELKRKSDNWTRFVVVTSDSGSKLSAWARQNNIVVLENPSNVAGRFSVFSPVGIFPLIMAGTDVKKMLQGAKKMVQRCVLQSDDNPALISALAVFDAIKNGAVSYNLFLFRKNLERMGKWCQQLIGESLGKDGKGILPITSIGTEDLHSMYQLFMGGPKNIFTSFLRVGAQNDAVIPNDDIGLGEIVPNISGKSVSYIMCSIYEAVKKSYENKKIPFCEVLLGSMCEEEIGEFLQFKMAEIIILAKLIGVNAFSQDNVEEYKKIARELIS